MIYGYLPEIFCFQLQCSKKKTKRLLLFGPDIWKHYEAYNIIRGLIDMASKPRYLFPRKASFILWVFAHSLWSAMWSDEDWNIRKNQKKRFFPDKILKKCVCKSWAKKTFVR